MPAERADTRTAPRGNRAAVAAPSHRGERHYNRAREARTWISPPSRTALAEQDIDGWLLYDFRGSNPIARSVIGFDESQIGTRRWFYLIPRAGEPVAILHAIEPHALRGAPGRKVLYRSWRELEALLTTSSRACGGWRWSTARAPPSPTSAASTPAPSRWCARRGPRSSSSADLVQFVRGALDARAEGAPRPRRRATPCWPRTRPSR